MTYSIVAHDPATGQSGVAVQTCNLAVGMWVPWAEGGVGAVATQSHADRTYGTLGLALMRSGKNAQQALAGLLATDERADLRQVAMVDRQGMVAVHTGKRCLPEAGHYRGRMFSVQANMMARNTVWLAMAEAYETANGDLPERLLAALDAAQAQGGDIRGQQTAAMLVVDNQRESFPLVDLRVDHDPQPLAELRRLLGLHRAYMAEYRVSKLVAGGEMERAAELLDQIAQWAPDEAYLHFLRAYHLAGSLDRWAEAVTLLQTLVDSDPVWLEYLRRDAVSNTFEQPGLAAKLLADLTPDYH